MEHPSYSFTHVVDDVSDMTGISTASVFKIVNEYRRTGEVTPTVRVRKPWSKKPDSSTQEVILRKVRAYFENNETGSVRKLVYHLKEDDSLPKYGRTKWYNVLKELGVSFEKRNRKGGKFVVVNFPSIPEGAVTAVKK